MATKRTIELNSMDVPSLNSKLKELEAEHSKMKFDHSIKGLANPMELVSVKREIAKINTEIRKRELSLMTAEQLAGRSKIRLRRRLKK
jgi:large subunit ribosomal protein L29